MLFLPLSQFIVYLYAFAYHRSCLKMGFQLHLYTQLTNQSCHECIFLSPTCLYQMGLPYVLSIHFMPTCLYHADNPSEIDFNFTFKFLGPTQQICILKYKLKLLFCHRRTKKLNFFFNSLLQIYLKSLWPITRICCRRKVAIRTLLVSNFTGDIFFSWPLFNPLTTSKSKTMVGTKPQRQSLVERNAF